MKTVCVSRHHKERTQTKIGRSIFFRRPSFQRKPTKKQGDKNGDMDQNTMTWRVAPAVAAPPPFCALMPPTLFREFLFSVAVGSLSLWVASPGVLS